MSSYRLNKELHHQTGPQMMQQQTGCNNNNNNNNNNHNNKHNQDSEITSEHKHQIQQQQIDTVSQNEN